ncbi:MAG TPA: aldehyde dehydrogenase family protein, partial [Acidimicrobiales bacterium]
MIVVQNPSTGEVLESLPVSDAAALVATARDAHPAWERTAPGERAGSLKRGARRLRDSVDEIAELQ